MGLFLSLTNHSILAQKPSTKKPTAEKSDAKDKISTDKDGKDKAGKPDYSDEAVVVEKLVREYHFEADGAGWNTFTARIRIQTQAGVQQFGQLIFGYNSANEKLDVIYLRVSKPDGSDVVNGTDANYQDLPSPIEREAPSYSDYRERHISVPAMAPGRIVEYQIKTTITEPLIPEQFWFEHNFNRNIIVLDEQLILDVPSGKNVNVKFKTKSDFNPDYTPTIARKDGRTIYKWYNTYLKREKDEDLKKKRKREVKYTDYHPDVQVTTFRTWAEIGEWFASLEKKQAAPDEAVKSKVAELTKNAKTDEEKIRAVYDYVAQSFRYVSLSFGVGRYKPHSASEIMEHKYGDCKDKHTLLTSMLGAAGFKVYPVLINSNAGRKLDPDVPSPAQFDHVISAIMGPSSVSGSDAPEYWADTTSEIAPFGLLTYGIRKKDALLAALDGTPRLIETPSNPPFLSYQDITVTGSITELGKLKATVKGVMRGDTEFSLRSTFRSVPENKWKDVANYISASSGIGGEAKDVKVKYLTDTDKPFEFEYQVEKPNFFDLSNKKSELVLPFPVIGLAPAGYDDDDETKAEGDDPEKTGITDTPASANDDDNDTAPVDKNGQKREAKPIQLGSPYDLRLHLNLEIPAKYKTRQPVPLGVKRDYAEYKSNYKLEGHKLTADRTLTIKLREIPYDRRNDYLAFAAIVRNDEKQKMRMETDVAADTAPTIAKEIKTEEIIESAREALQNNNYKYAIDLLLKASEKEPKNKLVWNLLGAAYLSNRQFDESISAFNHQITNNPYDQFAYLYKGRAFYMKRDFDSAIESIQHQLDVNPLDLDSLVSLSEIQHELKHYQESADAMEKAVSLKPGEGLLHADLGREYLNLKRDKEAIEEFDKAVELSPNALLWNNISYEIAQAESKPLMDRALQYAESAVAAVASELRNATLERVQLRDIGNVTSLASYWDTLGWVAFKQGNNEKAIKYIKASWMLDQSGEVGDHMAQIFQKQGKKDEALKLFAQAASAQRPPPENAGRLAVAAGIVADPEKFDAKDKDMKTKWDSIVAKYKQSIVEERTIKLPSIVQKKAEADFFILLSQPGKVDAVKFISGSDLLKTSARTALLGADYGEIFPDATPTRIIRRVAVRCTDKGECSMELLVPETITSVD